MVTPYLNAIILMVKGADSHIDRNMKKIFYRLF